jgi:cupin fold WbuC family metalloprotein
MIRALRRRGPLNLHAHGPDVFYCSDAVVHADGPLIEFLKAHARASPRKRSRLCMHPAPDAAVHEMLIVHHRDVYVRPHRHYGKAESVHSIEGDAFLLFFGDDGALGDVLALDSSADAPFYCRIPAGVFHAYVIRSEWLVFHETTAGPFDRAALEYAPWSPDEADRPAVAAFLSALSAAAESFLTKRERLEPSA